MDFKAIEYICAIADAKTISQAAKNLFVSQPALSQALIKAEQEVGTALFIRSGNQMIPTSAGELLIREGSTMLLMRKTLLDHLSTMGARQSEVLRFGISPFYSKYYLPLLLPYYQKHFPDIRLEIIELSSTELEQKVLNGELNLCFIPSEPMREGLHYQPIYMEEIMIAIPKDHPANAYAISSPGIPYLDLTLLKNDSFVTLIPSLKFSIMSRRIFRHFGLSPNVIYESTNWDTVCMLVGQGIGVGLLPAVLIHKHIHEPNFYRISDIDSTRAYSAVYLKDKRLSPAELMLIEVFESLLKHQ